MGPIILFDKSFLQSLSIDESVWFDRFFLSNISPLFYVETLADLEKAVREGRTPEDEVRIIADKTPEMDISPNIFHAQLCISNLQGHPVTMDGRPIIAGGNFVKASNQSGVVFDVSPEAQAFARWQQGEFLKLERELAKDWRKVIDSLNFETVIEELNSIGINPRKCKTLEEVKELAENIIKENNQASELIKFAFMVLGIPSQLRLPIYKKWFTAGCPPLHLFAPYSAYVLTIEIFFYIAAAAGLIAREKVTNKIDIAYLFYLPFCMVFTSSDRFHKRCAPLFLRDDQEFIWGFDLKEDLKKLDCHFNKLPDSEKEKGLYAIATRPPTDKEFLVTRLWDRFLHPRWRARPKSNPPQENGIGKKMFDDLSKFTDAKPLDPDQVDFDPTNPDTMVLKREIRMKKGKWWQLPKDLKDNNEE